MENNRKDRIWEEDIPMRKLTVDDAVLFNLKKIYFRQVEELCAPVLKKAGYSVGKIGFRNVNVLANCPFVQELRFYDCVGGVLSLFVFKASRGGEDFLAAYAPYSSKIYLLKDSGDRLPEGAEFVDCGASEGIVRLNVKYSFQENGSDVYKYVYLYFRTARIEKTFFLRRPFLRLIGDSSIRKTVSREHKDELEAFTHGFLFSECYRNSDLFSLTGKKQGLCQKKIYGGRKAMPAARR